MTDQPSPPHRVIPEHPVPGKPLGRHYQRDARSAGFPVLAAPARVLVATVHQRRVPIFTQDIGSCTGEAAIGAVGTEPLWSALTPAQQATVGQPLAVRAYSGATKRDPFEGWFDPATGVEDTGSDGLSVCKEVKDMGLIGGYLHARTVTEVSNALQDTPVLIGVPWYEGFDDPDSAGRITVAGSVRGGHELYLLGVDPESREYRGVQSWGPEWGQDGYFLLSFDTLDRLLNEDGEAMQPLPLAVPPPPVAPAEALRVWRAATRQWATSRHICGNAQAAKACRDLSAALGL